jgi:hypothetical protein
MYSYARTYMHWHHITDDIDLFVHAKDEHRERIHIFLVQLQQVVTSSNSTFRIPSPVWFVISQFPHELHTTVGGLDRSLT